MAKTKEQKKKEVDKLKARLEEAKGVVFVDYRGLTVKEVEELRKNLRANKVDYLVAKKTLAKIALDESGQKDIDVKKLEGQMAIAFGLEDEVMPAKLLFTFAKEHQALKLLGGIVEGQYFEQEQIVSLAQLPTKKELLAQAVGSIKAPISGFVQVLRGNLQSLIYVLKAISESKN